MKQFTMKQQRILSEIYRRLHKFNKVDGKCLLDAQLLLLAVPSVAKELIKIDIIKPSCRDELPRVTNWYKLTPKGKKLFEPYVNDTPSEEYLLGLFTGIKTKYFPYPTE